MLKILLFEVSKLLIITSTLISCTTQRPKLDSPEKALIKIPIQELSFSDDLNYKNFAQNLSEHIEYLQSKKQYILQFGKFKVNSLQYAKSLEKLYSVIKEDPKEAEAYGHRGIEI